MPTPLPQARPAACKACRIAVPVPAAAPGRQQRDVDDVQLRLPHLQIKPPGRLAALLDHVEGAVGEIFAVMGALRLELARQERLLLLGAPRHLCQFLLARRGIERNQERNIAFGLRPQREALRQQGPRQGECRRR